MRIFCLGSAHSRYEVSTFFKKCHHRALCKYINGLFYAKYYKFYIKIKMKNNNSVFELNRNVPGIKRQRQIQQNLEM